MQSNDGVRGYGAYCFHEATDGNLCGGSAVALEPIEGLGGRSIGRAHGARVAGHAYFGRLGSKARTPALLLGAEVGIEFICMQMLKNDLHVLLEKGVCYDQCIFLAKLY